jgi:sugar/nucleoside kinase (ribokinase family)
VLVHSCEQIRRQLRNILIGSPFAPIESLTYEVRSFRSAGHHPVSSLSMPPMLGPGSRDSLEKILKRCKTNILFRVETARSGGGATNQSSASQACLVAESKVVSVLCTARRVSCWIHGVSYRGLQLTYAYLGTVPTELALNAAPTDSPFRRKRKASAC